MKLVRLATFLAVTLALALTARPSAAEVLPPAPADLHSAARASHTAAIAKSERARHAAHHRHHRGARLARIAAAPAPPRPQPLQPAKPRPELRAALPRAHRTLQDHGGARPGSRMLATVPGLPSLLTVAVTPLDPDQNESLVCVEGFVFSGRGPPRAGPPTSLPPPAAGGLPLILLSPAPAPHRSGRFDAPPPDGVARRALACAQGALPVSFPSSQEPLPSCSHPCRPEGAAGCWFMPSVGGSS